MEMQRRIKPFPTSAMKKAATHPAGNSLQDAANSLLVSRNSLFCAIKFPVQISRELSSNKLVLLRSVGQILAPSPYPRQITRSSESRHRRCINQSATFSTVSAHCDLFPPRVTRLRLEVEPTSLRRHEWKLTEVRERHQPSIIGQQASQSGLAQLRARICSHVAPPV